MEELEDKNCIIIPKKEYKKLLGELSRLKIESDSKNIEIRVNSYFSGYCYGSGCIDLDSMDIDIHDGGSISLSKDIKSFINNVGDKLTKHVMENVKHFNEDKLIFLKDKVDSYNSLPWYKKIFTFKI